MTVKANVRWNRWVVGVGWSLSFRFFQIAVGPLLIEFVGTPNWSRVARAVHKTGRVL